MRAKEFVIGVNSKKRDSWKELYRYFYSALCNYSSKITNNRPVSEDIVQNMFIGLWDSEIIFENYSKLTAYLYKAVYTRSLNFLRDNKYFNSPIEQHEKLEATTEDYYIEMALEEEIISKFYQAMEQLSSKQRDVILMSMKGDKISLIAEKLDISINSVKTHKKRAYSFLKNKLGDNFSIIILLLFP